MDAVLRDTSRVKEQLRAKFAPEVVDAVFGKLYEAALMRQMATAKFEQAKTEIISQLRQRRTAGARKSLVPASSRNRAEVRTRPESCAKLRRGTVLKTAKKLEITPSLKRSTSTLKPKRHTNV